jgi:hypothetical protein
MDTARSPHSTSQHPQVNHQRQRQALHFELLGYLACHDWHKTTTIYRVLSSDRQTNGTNEQDYEDVPSDLQQLETRQLGTTLAYSAVSLQQQAVRVNKDNALLREP